MDEQTPLAIAAGLGWGSTFGLAIALWVALMRFAPPPGPQPKRAAKPSEPEQEVTDFSGFGARQEPPRRFGT